jgi:hypothetical protein
MRNREMVYYKHQELMSDYNEMMIKLKKALYLNGEIPDVRVDDLQNQVFEVLRKEEIYPIKYSR